MLLISLSNTNAFGLSMGIDDSIQLFQNADFERAKSQFKVYCNNGNNRFSVEDKTIACCYLALIEIAFGNSDSANGYIVKMLSIDPSLTLNKLFSIKSNLKDHITPDFEKRFNEILDKSDEEPPKGDIKGIKQSYSIGEDVSFVITGKDNFKIHRVEFDIDNLAISKSWRGNADTIRREFSFNTKDMKPGHYTYTVVITDHNNNKTSFSGAFRVKQTKYQEEVSEELTEFSLGVDF